MHRIAALFLLLTATASQAAEAPADTRQFLDKSVVTLPDHVEAYTLQQVAYYPEQWFNGVTSNWSVNAAPQGMRLSVFVYPVGRGTESDVVVRLIDEVTTSMKQAVDEKLYTDLAIGERDLFEVDGMKGIRQAYAVERDGKAARSLAYVFYRHLFAFKVRITTDTDSMDEALFTALSDTAARWLVPRMHVQNYGRCGDPAVLAQGRDENCIARDAPMRKPLTKNQVEIVFPPNTWRSPD